MADLGRLSLSELAGRIIQFAHRTPQFCRSENVSGQTEPGLKG